MGRAGEGSDRQHAGVMKTASWFFYLLFCLSLGLAWYFHRDATTFSNRHELWSDRAGYYIYLPAAFFWHFDARRMPADLDIRTGGGFAIDSLRNRIDTKYTYGVALMQAPFFVAAGMISRVAGFDSEQGFSIFYMRMMMVAAVVYLILGLWLLKKFLDRYFRPGVVYLVLLLLYAGTHLFYYSLIDGMMSHVYSFFLVSLYLVSLVRFRDTGHYRWFLLLSAALALITLIRPVNLLLVLLLPAWNARGFAAFWQNLRLLAKPRFLLALAGCLFLAFLPQMIYWRYLSGRWIHFSYGNEGFTHWRQPRIAEVLFSPLNGLIPVTPLMLVIVAAILWMLFRKKTNAWMMAAVFVSVTYICGAWSMWYFGCSYGQRSFIEYLPLFAIPLGFAVTGILEVRRVAVQAALLFMLLLTVYLPLRYTLVVYRHDRCYYGSTWDWSHYLRALEKAGIFSPVGPVASFENDFENLAIFPGRHPSALFTRSGQYSVRSDAADRRTVLFERPLYEFGGHWPKRFRAEARVFSPGRLKGGEALSWEVTRDNSVIFTDSIPLAAQSVEPLSWSRVAGEFILPDVPDSSLVVRIFLDNPDGTMLFADDLSVRFLYGWRP